MRKTLRRFSGLKKLADNREALAAKVLAESLAQLEAKQQELDRMRAYADEYRRARHGKATDSVRMSNLNIFTGQLSGAIDMLEKDVALAMQAFRADLEQWRSGYRRSKGLEQLVEQYRRELVRLEDQREQKHLDESVNQRGGKGPQL